jgi:hypothetical protein
MERNLVDAELTAADLQDVHAAIGTISSKLPFLISLTAQEKASLFKLGDTYRPFVDKAVWLVENFPAIMPGTFDKAQFKKDLTLFNQMVTLNNNLQSAAKTVDDTLTAVGSDVILAALEIYDAGKNNEEKIPGLKPIIGEMKSFFPRKRKAQEPAPVQ